MFSIPKGVVYVLATYPHNPKTLCQVKTTAKINEFTKKDVVLLKHNSYDKKVSDALPYFLSGSWVGFRKNNFIMFVFTDDVSGLEALYV